jgi:hypothetical protein
MTPAPQRQAFSLPRHLGTALLFWTAVGVIFALPQLGQSAHWERAVLLSLAQWWA